MLNFNDKAKIISELKIVLCLCFDEKGEHRNTRTAYEIVEILVSW